MKAASTHHKQSHLPVALRKSTYDARIDFFRGLSLIFIFINHIPDNALSYITSRSYALFDSAEVFMFLGGYSAAIAYAALAPKGLQALARKALLRAGKILAFHICLIVLIMLSAFLVIIEFDMVTGYEIFIEKIFNEPFNVLLATPLLAFQAPLLDILPMYVFVMLCAPFMIWLLARSPLALLVVSGLVWLFAARFFPLVPTITYGIHWGFNPFCWQFMFAIGLACGWYGRKGGLPIASPEARKVLDIVCLAFVVFSAVVLLAILFQSVDLKAARELRGLYLSLNKTCLDMWRIIGLLATTYVIVRLVSKDAAWLYGSSASALRAAGAHSLPIFALGVFLSFAGKMVAAAYHSSVTADLVVSAIGIAILLGVAVALREAKAGNLQEIVARRWA